jgi:anti-sigma B factor antagonist
MERRFFVGGEVDMATAPRLRSNLLEAVEQYQSDLVLDCVALTFIDSSGVRVLLEVQAFLAQRDRRFRMINVGRAPGRAFQVLGVTDTLQVGWSKSSRTTSPPEST